MLVQFAADSGVPKPRKGDPPGRVPLSTAEYRGYPGLAGFTRRADMLYFLILCFAAASQGLGQLVRNPLSDTSKRFESTVSMCLFNYCNYTGMWVLYCPVSPLPRNSRTQATGAEITSLQD